MDWKHQGNEWYTDVRGDLDMWAWVKIRAEGEYEWRVEDRETPHLAGGSEASLDAAKAAALTALDEVSKVL